ncbi:hypothetical protein CIT292_11256 [Citrobacter youngae ATCC 29220]|uniref:Uncharacterized protein n=1 Tax=Citrobacter youngae ATCC 29220 TaxID=500640 RepID=D4BL16_9ENTR|nr:hypothetical protein CIT292_11256 [Citrobacter youngae ATCC 29220]
MDNAFINTEVSGRQIVDQTLAKIIERFLIEAHKRLFARFQANQIVVSHEQVLTNIQPTIDQFVMPMDTLFQVF